MTIAVLREVDDHGHQWTGLVFWCPGCEEIIDGERQAGLHMLPVSGDANGKPMWTFDGNLDAPTLTPSILTRMEHKRRHVDGELVDVGLFVCHSYMRAGQMEFLSDCTHPLAGQTVPLPDLPDWAARLD